MLTKENLKYYAGPCLFFLMLLDGQLTRLIEYWTEGMYIASVHFLLLGLMCASMVLPKSYMMLTGLILGTVFDFYYIGVLGIYAVVLPLMIWLMFVLAPILYENTFTLFFGSIIMVTCYELFTLGIQLIFQLTQVDPMFFVARFLGPTLLLNMIIFILFIYPFKKLFQVK
ncbi:MAG: rod shape-determining protein MreD [Enterococcus sp.]